MNLKSVLFLDDTRVPTLLGIARVKDYDEFVEYLTITLCGAHIV